MTTTPLRKQISRTINATAAILTGIASFSAMATQPQEVDLGLSVLWADRNLGADMPGETGEYYAYGETFPKETYNWETYTLCDGEWFLCHDLGTTDISGTKYDAAQALLGNGWHMPTKAQCEELLSSCSITLHSESNGTECAILTAQNGQQLHLPLSGYYNSSKLYSYGKEAYFYSSSNEPEEEEEDGVTYRSIGPYYMAITASGPFGSLLGSAHLGLNIRPVKNYDPSSLESITDYSNPPVTDIFSIDGRRLSHTSTASLTKGIYILRRSDGSVEKRIVR